MWAHLEHGTYADLTYERVASFSGVAKTTLYRHWPSKAEMVFDLVLHDRELPALDDTGSAEGDIAALADRIVTFVAGGVAGQVFAGVIADVVRHLEVAARFTELFIVPARPLIATVLERIAHRLGGDGRINAEDAQAILIGSVFYWTSVGGLTLDEARRRTESLITTLVRGQ